MEKAYLTMRNAGACNITLGVILIVVGVTAGILTIVSGAGLLKNKNHITF